LNTAEKVHHPFDNLFTWGTRGICL